MKNIGKLQLIQYIGNNVCEGCGPDSDCGMAPGECDRVEDTIDYLDRYLKEHGTDKLKAENDELIKALKGMLGWALFTVVDGNAKSDFLPKGFTKWENLIKSIESK
jgi:hypothetical protein